MELEETNWHFQNKEENSNISFGGNNVEPKEDTQDQIEPIKPKLKVKRCPKCGRVLPLSEFYNSNSSKDGKASYCKECANIATANSRRRRNEELESAGLLPYQKGECKTRMKMSELTALLTPRDMMVRLAKMGYKGVLVYDTEETEMITHNGKEGKFTYTERHEVDIVKLMNEEDGK